MAVTTNLPSARARQRIKSALDIGVGMWLSRRARLRTGSRSSSTCLPAPALEAGRLVFSGMPWWEHAAAESVPSLFTDWRVSWGTGRRDGTRRREVGFTSSKTGSETKDKSQDSWAGCEWYFLVFQLRRLLHGLAGWGRSADRHPWADARSASALRPTGDLHP